MNRRIFLVYFSAFFAATLAAQENPVNWPALAADYYAGDATRQKVLDMEADAEVIVSSAHAKAQKTKPVNWIVSENLEALCNDIADSRRTIAEIALMKSNTSWADYLEAKRSAEQWMQGLEESIDNVRQEAIVDMADFPHAHTMSEIAARDQGPKYFLYMNRDALAKDADVAKYVKTISAIDECKNQANAVRFFNDILDKDGWPLLSRYGSRPAYYYFIVVQHSSADPVLMRRVQALLKKLAEEGEANPKYYADLTDKIRILEGKSQRFGTFVNCINGRFQIVNGVDQPETLNQRRAKYGFSTIEEQFAELPKHCGTAGIE